MWLGHAGIITAQANVGLRRIRTAHADSGIAASRAPA